MFTETVLHDPKQINPKSSGAWGYNSSLAAPGRSQEFDIGFVCFLSLQTNP